VHAAQNFQAANKKQIEDKQEDIIIEEPLVRLPEYEKLTYKVRWLGVPVGVITASIKGI